MQHYIVVFSPSVSFNSHLEMRLHGPWTGSYCRCRGTVPLHAIKHLPEEWQGTSSHSPAATPSHWPLLHHRRQRRQGEDVTEISFATDLVWSRTREANSTSLSFGSDLLCMPLKGTAPRFNKTGKMEECLQGRVILHSSWYKHSLVHLKWCLKKCIHGFPQI